MPHDLAKWQSVYTYFRAWEKDGTWLKMNDELRTFLEPSLEFSTSDLD
jgi:putative transposase